jgi:four helix bundle protein
MQDFRKLEVWQRAHSLAKAIYVVFGKLSGRHLIVLSDQVFRAALSVPTNIVEGRAHTSDREFARYLRIALASAAEVEYQVFFARDVEAIDDSDFRSLNAQVVEVRKMLVRLIARLGKP